jgi:hypothetical protein
MEVALVKYREYDVGAVSFNTETGLGGCPKMPFHPNSSLLTENGYYRHGKQHQRNRMSKKKSKVSVYDIKRL